MNVIYKCLLSKNRNWNGYFYTGCNVMYFAGFYEQRQGKQRKSEREKVNIEETRCCFNVRWNSTLFQRTLKLDVVSTLKSDVSSITKSNIFNVVSTLKVNVVSTLKVNVVSTLKERRCACWASVATYRSYCSQFRSITVISEPRWFLPGLTTSMQTTSMQTVGVIVLCFWSLADLTMTAMFRKIWLRR